MLTNKTQQKETVSSNEKATRVLERAELKILSFHFPWLSAFASLFFIALLVIGSKPDLIIFYRLSNFLFLERTTESFIFILGFSYLLDVIRFRARKKEHQLQITQLQQQLEDVWESKKKQQQRANIYADNADKLKYFISEKLLDSIKYDEKYLHFKGVASEVRHNGVISYDKVITALNKVMTNASAKLESDDILKSQYEDEISSCQTALDAIRYLWDLLDLSTAENMGLHIGNQLIECEEHYYQLSLDSAKKFDITQSIPVLPTFSPQLAMLMTLGLLYDEPIIKNKISSAKRNKKVLSEPFLFFNEQFHLELATTPMLLGNHNHIILLLENIIKNALFFSQKNRLKQRHDKIIIRLLECDGYVHISIYNRGPQIKSENKTQIFQLGYSTRKSKLNHGKGLGLYFASEIVRGYNGQIEATNIDNIETNYLLKINFEQQQPVIHALCCRWEGDRMKVRDSEINEFENEFKCVLKMPIVSFELTNMDGKQVLTDDIVDKETLFEWIEESTNLMPKLSIQIKPFKKQHCLTLKPLDVRGVCVDIKLPTADSRLNEQEIRF